MGFFYGSGKERLKDMGVLKTQGHLFVLIYLLTVQMKSPGFSALWAIVTSIIVSSLGDPLNLEAILRALESGAKGALTDVAAGIVKGVVKLTALG